jgi:hypothetical protein
LQARKGESEKAHVFGSEEVTKIVAVSPATRLQQEADLSGNF